MIRAGVAGVLCACLGVLAWRHVAGIRSPRPALPRMVVEGSKPGGSSTVSLHGTLTSRAYAHAEAVSRGADAIVIVLRDRDRRACEDLGRQLRELQREAGPRMLAMVTTDSAASEMYVRYLRREHVRATVVVLSPDSVLEGYPGLPTPAVLVRHGTSANGVAHPVRFPNLRLISFAAELRPLLR
ncbi:MAG TPA: hypothetical protein VFJ16_23040 [Longimicrobium sp.]|nr:hypothetical protein [Longimicrobium sp.]